MAPTIVTEFLAYVCTCADFNFRSSSRASFPPRRLLRFPLSLWSWRRLLLLRKRGSFQIMMIVWFRMSLSIVHTRVDLMRMPRLVHFLLLLWRSSFLQILWSLSGLIRCGLFFAVAMSPLDSLFFLLLFIRSRFFARMMLPLMLSSISSVVWRQIDTLGPRLSPTTYQSYKDHKAALELRHTYLRVQHLLYIRVVINTISFLDGFSHHI
jgi:hypothetical protein